MRIHGWLIWSGLLIGMQKYDFYNVCYDNACREIKTILHMQYTNGYNARMVLKATHNEAQKSFW